MTSRCLAITRTKYPCSDGLLSRKKWISLWKIDKPPRKWDLSAALTGRLLLTLKERNCCSYFQAEGKLFSFPCSELLCEKQSQQGREGTALIHYSHGVCQSHLSTRAAQLRQGALPSFPLVFVVFPPSSWHLVHVCENFLVWRKAGNTREIRSSAWSCSPRPWLWAEMAVAVSEGGLDTAV